MAVLKALPRAGLVSYEEMASLPLASRIRALLCIAVVVMVWELSPTSLQCAA